MTIRAQDRIRSNRELNAASGQFSFAREKHGYLLEKRIVALWQQVEHLPFTK
jgi:hypothetical protein